MSNGVVLGAAMRSNLLSLQQTQKNIDSSQLKLATGKKVNSALDNPQSFFASSSLQNRASDLNRLLDSIGQNIQVIKAADNGVTALTKLVEQADSVTNSARDALAQGTQEAKVVGNRDLRGIGNLSGETGMTATGAITLSMTDKDGKFVSLGLYGTAGSVEATPDIALNIIANESADDIIARINDIYIQKTGATTAIGEKAFEAKLNDKGQLEVKALNGNNFTMNFRADATGSVDTADLAYASALGFSDLAKIQGTDTAVAANNTVGFTATAQAALSSFTLHKVENNVTLKADRSTLMTDLRKSDGTTAIATGLDNAADLFRIGINGETMANVALTRTIGGTAGPATVQEFIDNINNNSALKGVVEASFNDETGQIVLAAKSSDVKSIQLGLQSDAVATTLNLGFGGTGELTTGASAATRPVQNIQLSAAAGQLAGFEKEFNNIREQITQLVSNGDTGYRGTNLLSGDDLLTTFNESRSSTLKTEGQMFTADGLGIDNADFSSASKVEHTMNQVSKALESIREFGSTLANDLSIIQARQDFTTSMVNTLQEGSDKLVNVDQNEEGAKLLALQTRQSLGITSLSLASQSQQSILRLF
jgi:flagellin